MPDLKGEFIYSDRGLKSKHSSGLLRPDRSVESFKILLANTPASREKVLEAERVSKKMK